ncbi:hypothetical protein [Lentimicrobium sp. S6]|uniref:hypothetical protein n=1 Tax=Lentimicrobium sp. S6 TaxID=2735872 RepID=UPI001557F05E|nr:hypothetical protein [Lentimicrobium sp. S6]NPD46784.1 hypothetical protein [Lentimicrobium sp. S6]
MTALIGVWFCEMEEGRRKKEEGRRKNEEGRRDQSLEGRKDWSPVMIKGSSDILEIVKGFCLRKLACLKP